MSVHMSHQFHKIFPWIQYFTRAKRTSHSKIFVSTSIKNTKWASIRLGYLGQNFFSFILNMAIQLFPLVEIQFRRMFCQQNLYRTGKVAFSISVTSKIKYAGYFVRKMNKLTELAKRKILTNESFWKDLSSASQSW